VYYIHKLKYTIIMKNLTKILKAAADTHRLKILKLLGEKNLCVCELQFLLGLSQPAVSHHLKVLSNAGLIGSEKEGLFVNYFLEKGGEPSIGRLMEVLLESIGEDDMGDLLERVGGVHRDELLERSR